VCEAQQEKKGVMALGTTVRDRLRQETAEIHERLHGHPGLAAAASGAITADDYARLLARLFGFHRAYESVLAETAFNEAYDLGFVTPVARSESLALDLVALGVDRATITNLPLCASIVRPSSVAELLGSRYVVEGSTLGGQLIARALEPRFGDNRRFFLSKPGNTWRALSESLEALAGDPSSVQAAGNAARTSFLDFERWMEGWRNRDSFATSGAEALELAPSAARR
jgi:heme oxygenase